MASGVLVGAMLGLVARMRFQRVLAACLMGGTAASLTWACSVEDSASNMSCIFLSHRPLDLILPLQKRRVHEMGVLWIG